MTYIVFRNRKELTLLKNNENMTESIHTNIKF